MSDTLPKSSHPPETLPTDATEALAKIASYIRTVSFSRDRRVVEKEPPKELIGYWQTAEWFEGLLQLAEAVEKRLMEPPAVPAPKILRFQNVELPLEYSGHGRQEVIHTLVAWDDNGNTWSVIAEVGGCKFVRIPDLPKTP